MPPGSDAEPRASPSCAARASTRHLSGSRLLEASAVHRETLDCQRELREVGPSLPDDRGHLVVRASVELAASHALLSATPLLEEERDSCAAALGAQAAHPGRMHRP